jgi:hypothetical protein
MGNSILRLNWPAALSFPALATYDYAAAFKALNPLSCPPPNYQ